MWRFVPALSIVGAWIGTSVAIGITATNWLPVPIIAGFVLLFVSAPWTIVINSIPHRDDPYISFDVPDTEEAPSEQENVKELLNSKSGNPTDIDPSSISNIETPRRLLANLELNQYLKSSNDIARQIQQQGISGTGLFKKGGWDFAMVGLTTLLFRHGNNKLSRVSTQNILSLLPQGGEPKVYVPYTLKRIFDTENHILMHVSSQYLANKWWRCKESSKAKKHDNRKNGLKEWLMGYLQHIRQNGFYEFNSIPYETYTIHALLNLAGFADRDVRTLAYRILDDKFERFAYGSYLYRNVAPFRRQIKRRGLEEIDASRLLPLVDLYTGQSIRDNGDHIAEMACCIPYKPPQEVIKRLRDEITETYTCMYGHGLLSSPEIYSGGPGYLLCAGGTYRGVVERIVERPITLLLNDRATTLDECFHIKGSRNNTGVWNGFAVADGQVHVPSSYEPVKKSNSWSVYYIQASQCVVCVASYKKVGCIVVYPEEKISTIEDTLNMLEANTNKDDICKRHTIFDPISNESIRFQPKAYCFLWVIRNKDTPWLDTWKLYQQSSSKNTEDNDVV